MALVQFKEHTKKSENRAIQASITDPLTGLYNRAYLNDLFINYCKESEKSGKPFAMLYMDLDGFKAVNDTHGHKAGDLILTEVADRINSWLGNRGDGIRIGGDELIVLNRLRANTTPEDLRYIAQQILNSIEVPVIDGEHEYRISTSIGVCAYEPGLALDEMIQRSDQLMYLAKQSGGKCIFIHNECADRVEEIDGTHMSEAMI